LGPTSDALRFATSVDPNTPPAAARAHAGLCSTAWP